MKKAEGGLDSVMDSVVEEVVRWRRRARPGEGCVNGNRRIWVPMRALTPAAPNSPIALRAGKSVKSKNFD